MNCKADARTGLLQYRKRERVEKQLDNLKKMMDYNRLRTRGTVSNEFNMFIRFLSFIIIEYTRKVLCDTLRSLGLDYYDMDQQVFSDRGV